MASTRINEQLERDIFGSDSELSEYDEPVQREVRPPRAERLSPAASPEPAGGAESGDEYKDDEGERRLPKFRKKKDRRERDEDVDGESRKRKRKNRRASSPGAAQPVDVVEVEMTAEERRRQELDAQIDSIIKPSKSGRMRKKRKNDEEILDRFADDEVVRLREAMLVAAESDVTSNENRQPATEKLKMLPQVMEVLQKSSLAQSILDNNLLEGVRRWLEPLPDKSLPALNIQNAFFGVLQKMYIDTASLKASGLGPLLLFYTKSTRVQPHIKRASDALIANWSRPIVRRSANYRDLNIPIASSDRPAGAAPEPSLARILAQGRKDNRRVRIPERVQGVYTVAPRGVVREDGRTTEADEMRERRKRDDQRLRKLQRKLEMARQAKARV